MTRKTKSILAALFVVAALVACHVTGGCTVLQAIAGEDTSHVSDADFDRDAAMAGAVVAAALEEAGVSEGERMVLGEAFLKVASGHATQVLYDAVYAMEIESPALELGVIWALGELVEVLEKHGCWVDGKLTERGAMALEVIGLHLSPALEESLLRPEGVNTRLPTPYIH